MSDNLGPLSHVEKLWIGVLAAAAILVFICTTKNQNDQQQTVRRRTFGIIKWPGMFKIMGTCYILYFVYSSFSHLVYQCYFIHSRAKLESAPFRSSAMGSSGSMVRALERKESKSTDQDELGFKPKVF